MWKYSIANDRKVIVRLVGFRSPGGTAPGVYLSPLKTPIHHSTIAFKKTPVHHSTIVLKGLRGALNWAPIMSRTANIRFFLNGSIGSSCECAN